MEHAHEAVFKPLLEARTAAASRIEAALSTEAVRGISTPARARAATAQVQDAIEPLRRSLLALDELAATAGTDEGWTQWIDQLRRVFSAADDACSAVAQVLGSRTTEDTPPRWYARNTR